MPAPAQAAAAGLALAFSEVELVRALPEGGQRRVLDAIDLQIGAGEQVAVVGASGAGKTSLLHVAAAALRPDAGTVHIDTVDPWALAPGRRQQLRREVFLAPQVPPLPPRQRVVTAVLAARLPQMGFWRSLLCLFKPVDLPEAAQALTAFGLQDRLYERVDRLSGGERQRVGLARASLTSARLWLLDEPLAGLDPVHAAEVLGTLRAQAARRGATLVVALHQAELASAHFPRIVGLRAGRVAFDEPPSRLGPRHWRDLYAGRDDTERTGYSIDAQAERDVPRPARWTGGYAA